MNINNNVQLIKKYKNEINELKIESILNLSLGILHGIAMTALIFIFKQSMFVMTIYFLFIFHFWLITILLVKKIIRKFSN